MMYTEHMLSTSDNPFNPYISYDEWFAWDTQAGYHTAGLVARVVNFPDEASDADESLAIEYGLQEIMSVLGVLRTPDDQQLYILVADPQDLAQPA